MSIPFNLDKYLAALAALAEVFPGQRSMSVTACADGAAVLVQVESDRDVRRIAADLALEVEESSFDESHWIECRLHRGGHEMKIMGPHHKADVATRRINTDQVAAGIALAQEAGVPL